MAIIRGSGSPSIVARLPRGIGAGTLTGTEYIFPLPSPVPDNAGLLAAWNTAGFAIASWTTRYRYSTSEYVIVATGPGGLSQSGLQAVVTAYTPPTPSTATYTFALPSPAPDYAGLLMAWAADGFTVFDWTIAYQAGDNTYHIVAVGNYGMSSVGMQSTLTAYTPPAVVSGAIPTFWGTFVECGSLVFLYPPTYNGVLKKVAVDSVTWTNDTPLASMNVYLTEANGGTLTAGVRYLAFNMGLKGDRPLLATFDPAASPDTARPGSGTPRIAATLAGHGAGTSWLRGSGSPHIAATLTGHGAGTSTLRGSGSPSIAATLAGHGVGTTERRGSGSPSIAATLAGGGAGTFTGGGAPPESPMVYTSNDTFVVPDGVTSLSVDIYAQGGNGAAGQSTHGGGGGGGGAYAGVTLTVSGGQTVTIHFDSSGAWASNTGSLPTNPTQGAFAQAGANASGGTGGAGGAAGSCVASVAYSGGNGGTAIEGATYGAGGGGGNYQFDFAENGGNSSAFGIGAGGAGGAGSGGNGGTPPSGAGDDAQPDGYGGGGGGGASTAGTGGVGDGGIIVLSW